MPTVESAHATAIYSSTRITPFQLDTRRQPATAIPLQEAASGPHAQFVQEREELVQIAKDQLAQTQERQAKYHNQWRKDVQYGVGDWDYLNAKVVNMAEIGQLEYDPTKDRNVNKLHPHWIGPYEVTARIGSNAYRINLPPYFKASPGIQYCPAGIVHRKSAILHNRSLSKQLPRSTIPMPPSLRR